MPEQKGRRPHPAYYKPYDLRWIKTARLFRVKSDDAGGWVALLLDRAKTPIAQAELVENRWHLQFRHINRKLCHYSFETRRRAAILNLGAAGRRACEMGWVRVLIHEIDAILSQRPLEAQTHKPGVVSVGAATALLSVETLALEFSAEPSAVSKWLSELGCPPTKAPNGHYYVSLWVLELCLMMRCLNLDPLSAAMQLAKAQSVYKAARKAAALDRLRSLTLDLARCSI